MRTVNGYVAAGFEDVARLLETGTRVQIGERARSVDLGSGGGAFAGFVDGECVVDLWTGDQASGIPWTKETRAVAMSATKGMTTLCAQLLFDRGELELDVPVATYWPEFSGDGKEGTLVSHVLSHQSGAIGVPGADQLLSWDGSGWADTTMIAAAIAEGPPAWEPGTRHGYHGLTYGWLVGEIVRRITGQTLGQFFRAEVAQPLTLECDIGTPKDKLPGVAQVLEWTRSSRPRRGEPAAIPPESFAGRSVLAGEHGTLFVDERSEPRFASFMNQPAVLTAEIGAIGATATARSLARLYAELAGGGTLVSESSIARFGREEVCGPDAVMRVPTRWAMGYTREPPALVSGVPRQHGPNDQAFGHMGAGGQVGFADPISHIACGFLRNHLEQQAMPLMGACLVQTLYRCAGVRS